MSSTDGNAESQSPSMNTAAEENQREDGSRNPSSPTTITKSETYEETHVHKVYNEIASHFSSTRYKPWPVVETFILTLPTGSIGLDIGSGNGKYLALRKDIYIIASDRSHELLKFAKRWVPHDTLVGDCLDLPHPINASSANGTGGTTEHLEMQAGRFDFAICIAVLHHLSTRERRREGVKAILDTLRRGGQGLVFVWALEQKGSRRGWDVGHEQDVLVPWVLKASEAEDGKERTLQRFYHLYREGELEEDVLATGGKVVRNGYDKDNWWVVFELM